MVFPKGGLVAVASTGAGGFALQNATPTIITWTVPTGLWFYIVPTLLIVTSAESGGSVSLSTANGNDIIFLWAAALNPGIYRGYKIAAALSSLALAGDIVEVTQTAALTAGASTLYGAILAQRIA